MSQPFPEDVGHRPPADQPLQGPDLPGSPWSDAGPASAVGQAGPPAGSMPGWPAQPGLTTAGQHPWLPSQPAPKPSVLPVEPQEYHEFLRTPSLRWWRPVLALLMAAGLFFAASTVLTLPAMLYDMSTGRTTLENYTSMSAFVMTPAFFLANNLALAACVPIAGLTQWACFGQRPRWLSSVTGGFRWGWFGECVLWVLPVFVLSLLLDVVLGGLPGQLRIGPETVFMLVAILLTTPLQAAGEEYLLRGLGQRAVASWLPRLSGLAVSTAITAVVFMLLHGAGDPWLNAFYLVFAVIGSVLAWRTGGIEAAVALHAVNNVVSMTFLPFTDFSDMFNRGPGAGSPVVLLQMAILAGALAVVLWRARIRDVTVRSAPGASVAREVVQPPASPMPVVWRQDHGNQAG